jgi:hypothetical protein
MAASQKVGVVTLVACQKVEGRPAASSLLEGLAQAAAMGQVAVSAPRLPTEGHAHQGQEEVHPKVALALAVGHHPEGKTAQNQAVEVACQPEAWAAHCQVAVVALPQVAVVAHPVGGS